MSRISHDKWLEYEEGGHSLLIHEQCIMHSSQILLFGAPQNRVLTMHAPTPFTGPVPTSVSEEARPSASTLDLKGDRITPALGTERGWNVPPGEPHSHP